jgi:sugar phosphate isomerase/epimerase
MFGISTCWWEGKEARGDSIPLEALDMGFEKLELDYRITKEALAQMRPALKGGAQVLSVHHVFPRPQSFLKGPPVADPVSLSSTDKDERAEAVKLAISTIQHAHDLEAKAVVIHLGKVDMEDPTDKLEENSKKGLSWAEEGQRYISELREVRNRKRQKNLDAVLFSLESINKEAEKRDILLGIENRLHFHEIPDIWEIGFILETFSGGNLRYWHDTGHAHVQEKLGILYQRELLERYGSQMLGVHLHDVKELEDHYPPGQGEVDFRALREHLRTAPIKVFEIRSSATRKEVLESLEFIHDLL